MSKPRIDLRPLDRAYREAWKQFCIGVTALHSLLSGTHSEAVVEDPANRVADAERSYRDNRNKLTHHMIVDSRDERLAWLV